MSRGGGVFYGLGDSSSPSSSGLRLDRENPDNINFAKLAGDWEDTVGTGLRFSVGIDTRNAAITVAEVGESMN